ncbi:MAG: hypothetical protein U0525_00590 [Patescibacteria group bacterium]
MKKIVYVFGNEDVEMDAKTFEYVEKLKHDFDKLEFVRVSPNSDVPFSNKEDVIIFDTVLGIDNIHIFSEKDIDKVQLSPRTSVHDFDLGFQIKYLLKLGKLKKIRIIGIPMNKHVDYSSIQETFRKFVAQDMHGS